MIFETALENKGNWDRFQIRNLGFGTQQLMASEFNGDATRMRDEANANMNRLCGTRNVKYPEGLAVSLLLVPAATSWSAEDKKLLLRIVEAKQSGTEARYLKLMQKHVKLRSELIRIGSL